MKKKLALTMVLLMMISLFAVGCGGGNGDKTVIARMNGDVTTWNPDTTPDDNASAVIENIYNRLVKLDASKKPIPDLAKEWEFSKDGKTLTFHLVENAKWHDGEPVTSKDVKYTFDTIKSNKTYFFNSYMETVDSIEAKDDNTVVFHLNSPDVPIISNMAWFGGFILPEHIFNKDGVKWEDNEASSTKPIGSGPFKFVEYKQGEKVVLEANEDYFAGAPKVKNVVFSIIPDDTTAVQALVNGELDTMTMVPAAEVGSLQKNDEIRLVMNEYPSPMYISFNLHNKDLAKVEVRTAVAKAVNRDEISKKIFDGISKPEYNMFPSYYEWASNSKDTAPKMDVEGAKALLEKAGYKKDKDGYYLTLRFDVFEGYGYDESAKLLKANLEAAGIKVKLNVLEFNAWNQKVTIDRDYDLQLQSGFQGPDPCAMSQRFGTDGAMNYSYYSNKDFDNLIEKARGESDQDTRAKYFKEAQAILAKDVTLVPIVGYGAYDANRTNVTNLPIDGEGKWGWNEYTYTEVN